MGHDRRRIPNRSRQRVAIVRRRMFDRRIPNRVSQGVVIVRRKASDHRTHNWSNWRSNLSTNRAQ